MRLRDILNFCVINSSLVSDGADSFANESILLEYDPNSILSLAGTPKGPTITIMSITKLFPYRTTVCRSYIYIL